MDIKARRVKVNFLALGLIFSTLILLASSVLATPTGPTSINIPLNETSAATTGLAVNISGGYISTLDINATTQNPHWKAIIGNVTGKFSLADSGGSTIYDWTLSSVGGEVYATRASGSITWGSIACANSTQIIAEDTYLEQTGEDNITSTFLSNNAGTFVVAGTQISAGACNSTNTYINNVSQSSDFEEVILYDTSNIVFATILEEDVAGYNGQTYDFQMLLPENGSSTWNNQIAYYIYVELS